MRIRLPNRELKCCGVVFKDIDLSGRKTIDNDRRGRRERSEQGRIGERAASFTDSEGNVLGIGQSIR